MNFSTLFTVADITFDLAVYGTSHICAPELAALFAMVAGVPLPSILNRAASYNSLMPIMRLTFMVLPFMSVTVARAAPINGCRFDIHSSPLPIKTP